MNFNLRNFNEIDLRRVIAQEQENFDLCLDLIWSLQKFKEYRKHMITSGLKILANVKPPCSKECYNAFVFENKWLGFGRFTTTRRRRIILFQAKILDIAIRKRHALENIKINN